MNLSANAHYFYHLLYTHFIDADLAPYYAAVFDLHLVHMIHLEGKYSKMHRSLHQVIN